MRIVDFSFCSSILTFVFLLGLIFVVGSIQFTLSRFTTVVDKTMFILLWFVSLLLMNLGVC